MLEKEKNIYHEVDSIKFITPDNTETFQSGALGKLEAVNLKNKIVTRVGHT